MRLTKHLIRALLVLVASCLPLVEVGMVAASITIQTVPVGNLGNAADTTGYGAVNYPYSMGEYDVTSSQYTAFLNAVAKSDTFGLYNSGMSGTTDGNPGILQSGLSGSHTYSVTGGLGNYPVTDVTFWDALRFANWLDNGQPTGSEGAGTTETGAYTLTTTGIADNTVTRNPGATWALPTENEWYKAAYYSPTLNSGAGGYWLYPTQNNSISTSQANYLGNGINTTTAVGSYPYRSYYGTYDQGGNVFQWNEAIIDGAYRGLRGGSFTYDNSYLESSTRLVGATPSEVFSDIGFRVAQVPEPASFGILALGAIGILLRRVPKPVILTACG